ncbi:heat shock 70 kDa protein 12B-like [Ruditapes philippinarum]|uniref:heat shock 70 kDa protein 12B-like n=1 Tax=Ruditapes philippinarum TaxID=129788 RepID=UPI00295AB6D6|nr:heat shock 70 kDa protein 12B-like [Ruditapes philippinarum]
MSNGNPLVVAALDFGTTFSSWAFSFKHEYEMEPTKVTAKVGYGLESAVSLKAPTSILIKPDGETFHLFGFDAETEYALLAEENQHTKYFFFQKFKMQLYDKMAGIDGQNLKIALEPEVASLYCQHIPGVDSLAMMKAGSKYLILDAGGPIVVKQFKEVAMVDYLDLMKSFELKKRTKPPTQGVQKVMVKIPTKLKTLTEEITGKVPEDTIAETRYKDGIKIVVDKLRFDIDIMNSFFKESVENIVGHLKELFMKPDVDACDVILMVGGYSESYHLQEKIKSNFPSKKVVTPNEAGLAVLKGAVMFGHNPALIAERKMKFTYGNAKFPGLFHVHVREGDTVKLGEEQPEQIFHPIFPFLTEVTVNLFCTKDRNPVLVADEGCIEIGTVTVPMPDTTGGCDRKVGVSFRFGGTEIEVKNVSVM